MPTLTKHKTTKPGGPEGSLDLEEELRFIMWLARDVCGYTELGRIHIDWFRELLTQSKLLLLAPRNHFKTTVATIVYTLYRIIRNNSVRVMILNEIQGNAKDMLAEIKEHMSSNEKFIAEFGNLSENARKWTTTAIQIKSGRMTKDPTISVVGTLGAINSKHCDLIICDDLISDNNSDTIAARNKIKKWFKQTVIPILNPGGQMIVTGTRWHSNDLYSDILNPKKFKTWKKVVLQAEWENDRGGWDILFPERFCRGWARNNKISLTELKDDMEFGFYNAQYLNDPTVLEALGFEFGWLKYYETPPAVMDIYMGTDLAISQEERSAKFAIVIIGIPVEGDIYVLDLHCEQLKFPAQCRLVKQMALKWHPIRIGIENNAYQDALPQWLLADPEAKTLPIHGTPTSANKILKLSSLSSPFEAGIIKIREDMHDFEDDYLGFPRGGTFDILDALYSAIEVSRENEVEPNISEVML